MTNDREIDIIVQRHPDADTDVNVFIDGEVADNLPNVNVVVIDPGKGWTEYEWSAARDADAAAVHPNVTEIVREAYDAQLGSPYIQEQP
jgi:hypothetical protein